jgi:hypothetical protein
MRNAIAWAIGLLIFVALPGAALAATPPRWPSAGDVRAATPGLSAEDAGCIARYYHGRLSGKAWFTPYYRLTPAQKVVTDAGFERCMTREQRTALVEHQGELDWGKYPQLQCVARHMVARTRAELRALTSIAAEARAEDRIFRACGLMGAVYAALGRATQLALNPAEQRCANAFGSAELIRPSAKAPTVEQRKKIGGVFERCVGRASELAMWKRLLSAYRPAAAIPCIARHSLPISFVTIFGDRPALQVQARRAVSACSVGGSTTS